MLCSAVLQEICVNVDIYLLIKSKLDPEISVDSDNGNSVSTPIDSLWVDCYDLKSFKMALNKILSLYFESFDDVDLINCLDIQIPFKMKLLEHGDFNDLKNFLENLARSDKLNLNDCFIVGSLVFKDNNGDNLNGEDSIITYISEMQKF